MKLFVTGGCGFIGSALISYWLENTPHPLVNYDLLTGTANPLSLRPFRKHPRYQWIKGSIHDATALAEALERFQPDAVVHLAALNAQQALLYPPDNAIKTNFNGTFCVLEATRSYWQELPLRKRSCFRFVYLSSKKVFGCPNQWTQVIAEGAPYAPNSPYSASQATASQLVKAWKSSYELPILLVHAADAYGPRQAVDSPLPSLVMDALLERPLVSKGEMSTAVDWLYVDDLVEGLVQLLIEGQTGESYHLSGCYSACQPRLLEVVCLLLDELKPKATSYLNLIGYSNELDSFPQEAPLTSWKIREQLGWQPRETLETGLRKTLHWYLGNSEWVAKSLQGVSTLNPAKKLTAKVVRGV